MKVAVFLKAVDRSTSGRADWLVRFEFNTNTMANEIVVAVPGNTDEDKIVETARSKLHIIFAAVAEHTASWRLPE